MGKGSSKYCGTGTDHWCNFAYTLTGTVAISLSTVLRCTAVRMVRRSLTLSTAVHPKGALFGKTPTAAPGTRITTRCKSARDIGWADGVSRGC